MDSPQITQARYDGIEDTLSHIIPRKPFPQYVDDTVFLEVKQLLSQRRGNSSELWTRNPRVYTLLRMLGYRDDSTEFRKIGSEQIVDFWLPLGPVALDQLSKITGIAPKDWQKAQLPLLSKPEVRLSGTPLFQLADDVA